MMASFLIYTMIAFLKWWHVTEVHLKSTCSKLWPLDLCAQFKTCALTLHTCPPWTLHAPHCPSWLMRTLTPLSPADEPWTMDKMYLFCTLLRFMHTMHPFCNHDGQMDKAHCMLQWWYCGSRILEMPCATMMVWGLKHTTLPVCSNEYIVFKHAHIHTHILQWWHHNSVTTCILYSPIYGFITLINQSSCILQWWHHDSATRAYHALCTLHWCRHDLSTPIILYAPMMTSWRLCLTSTTGVLNVVYVNIVTWSVGWVW
jgi:hypothetical protein